MTSFWIRYWLTAAFLTFWAITASAVFVRGAIEWMRPPWLTAWPAPAAAVVCLAAVISLGCWLIAFDSWMR